MGGKLSTPDKSGTKLDKEGPNFLEKIGDNVKTGVKEEINQRMMLQREIQLSLNIAKARDTIQIFGSAYGLFVSGAIVAKLGGKPVPRIVAVPVVVGGLLLGNLADFAYGNKLSRVAKEAEHILENERGRLVPFKQAPMAKYYTEEEKGSMLDKATPAGMLWPSNIFSRSFIPQYEDVSKTGDGGIEETSH